jgi:hypothetical protein
MESPSIILLKCTADKILYAIVAEAVPQQKKPMERN